MAYALGTGIVLASFWIGGWYWCLIYAAVVILHWRVVERVSYTLALPMLWVGLFAITGDRRLFFPFALYQAVVFGQLWGGGFAAGSALIIALFTLIRVEQEASLRVIAVELVVAVVAAFAGAGATRKYGRIAGAVVASLVALAGLAF